MKNTPELSPEVITLLDKIDAEVQNKMISDLKEETADDIKAV